MPEAAESDVAVSTEMAAVDGEGMVFGPDRELSLLALLDTRHPGVIRSFHKQPVTVTGVLEAPARTHRDVFSEWDPLAYRIQLSRGYWVTCFPRNPSEEVAWVAAVGTEVNLEGKLGFQKSGMSLSRLTMPP